MEAIILDPGNKEEMKAAKELVKKREFPPVPLVM